MKRGVWIALAIGIAAGLGFLAQRQLGGDAGTAAVAPPAEVAETTGDASSTDAASTETATPDPVVPETLPQFELADADGKKRRLGEWSGRPLMVNYWATWCAPCRREIPLLNELRAERASQKLEVVGIAVDFRDDVLAYAKQTTISYPLLIGEEDGLAAVQAIGMQPGFPFTVFADSKQRILTVKVGELHREEADLILDMVARVDDGTMPLEQARESIKTGLREIATRRAADEAGQADQAG